jgi:hypothetical protein
MMGLVDPWLIKDAALSVWTMWNPIEREMYEQTGKQTALAYSRLLKIPTLVLAGT